MGEITTRIKAYRQGNIQLEELIDFLDSYNFVVPGRAIDAPTDPFERMDYIDDHLYDPADGTWEELILAHAEGLLTNEEIRLIQSRILREGEAETRMEKSIRGLRLGKRGELYVVGKLLEKGAAVYLPALDIEGVDCIVHRGGRFFEIQVKTTTSGVKGRGCQVRNLIPRSSLYIGLVVMTEQPEAWIIPSQAFWRSARRTASRRGDVFDFDLDWRNKSTKQLLCDELSKYREAWHLLVGRKR